MVINNKNLSIAGHCENKTVLGWDCGKLYVSENNTFAINPVYGVAVSTLGNTGTKGCVNPEAAKALSNASNCAIGTALIPLSGNLPPLEKLLNEEKPVLFELKLELSYLLKLVQSAVDFEGEVVRIQFTGAGEDHPVRLDCRNKTTGQKWRALLMARWPDLQEDIDRYAEDEFEAAVRAAQSLGC